MVNLMLLLALMSVRRASIRNININIKSVFCFQIHGSDVAFYMASLSHEGIYTFTQVAKVKFPRSIAELPQFINMRAISQLLQASQCF
ncbi:uncharacterized protein RHIMIDRAFT_242466 [Rhizopus microsporus ATCC 52813]|uniref:Uncharacterized protein n=1 Tax=Rhizopus microsporus ATCC 52813 TaxID=1340429 RepID=A0A2G4SFV2_RHIZD|nr:uncharacterized protein RHIMIDRAFT_242466 [Rhizopus microsporus ATCC 52813]PHZ07644.1 hypothetical protein RHIMIDRAFT_242466 [Rhizopus microsporus ATCC 52813]